ncbi:MAG: peptidylprolyl isomerase [Gammaproteobacteria bacterium]|nr:peptidylprolyl isomerase [Gammaproteobacteria bacterium]
MYRHHRFSSRLACVLVLAGALPGCQHHARIDHSPLLATVNGERITQRDFANYVRARDQQEPALPQNAQSKRIILNELINRVLLAQAARRRGLQRRPSVSVALKEDRDNILARAMLQQFLATHPISVARLHALYRQDVLKGPHVEFKARHILVATKAQAETILADLHHGARFSVLARTYSLDVASGRRGGQLGWFSAGDILPSFYHSVASLRVGEISPAPVKTRFGWHIIQLEAERPYTPPPFADVERQLYRAIEQRRVDTMMAGLRAHARIHLTPGTGEPHPPAVPTGTDHTQT